MPVTLARAAVERVNDKCKSAWIRMEFITGNEGGALEVQTAVGCGTVKHGAM